MKLPCHIMIIIVIIGSQTLKYLIIVIRQVNNVLINIKTTLLIKFSRYKPTVDD